jgi:hypothetical protein
MNGQESPETGFARRLRAELKAVVAERGADQAAKTAASEPPVKTAWRRRGPRVGLAGAAVVGVAAVALIIGAGGGDTPAAFAVEAQPEGKVSVEVRSLEDPAGLETALGEAGISASVSYLGSGMICKEPRFQVASSAVGGRGALVTGPGALVSGPMGGEGSITFTVDRDEVGPGQTLVITAWPQPGALLGGAEMKVAEGAVAPCEPVPAPAADDNGGGGK